MQIHRFFSQFLWFYPIIEAILWQARPMSRGEFSI